MLDKINNGLGGIIFKEVSIEKYVRDFAKHAKASKYKEKFDISNWAFFMAFDEEKPIGAITVVSRTDNVNMLHGRNDLSVLWDIRVSGTYKHQGIGQKLFDLVVEWSRKNGFRQMKIECQNNNVPACKFYYKQGAILSKIDEYAYYNDIDSRDEIQLIKQLVGHYVKSEKKIFIIKIKQLF